MMSAHLPSDHQDAREGSIPVEGATLYYREIGAGQPLIILHGGPGFDHQYLLPDLDRLADAYRLIYYDQRGCGKSATNVHPSDVSLHSEMDDLEAVRAAFGLERVALLGHSWGAILAMEYALRHPERVSHLILLNTPPASHDDCKVFVQERDATIPGGAERLRELRSRPGFAQGDREARIAYYRVYYGITSHVPELLDRLLEHLQAGWTTEDVLRARAIGDRLWGETYDSTGYDLLPQLTQLRIPTLIVYGDYDFIPLSCVTHIAEAIPDARLVVLPSCGHFSYMERPDEVRTALDDFFHAS